jgi:hypothetical protein
VLLRVHAEQLPVSRNLLTMAIRITHIRGTTILNAQSTQEERHLAIEHFKWIDEQTLEGGFITREQMFEWVVNKRGVTYVREKQNFIPVPVFGRMNEMGQKYLRQRFCPLPTAKSGG